MATFWQSSSGITSDSIITFLTLIEFVVVAPPFVDIQPTYSIFVRSFKLSVLSKRIGTDLDEAPGTLSGWSMVMIDSTSRSSPLINVLSPVGRGIESPLADGGAEPSM